MRMATNGFSRYQLLPLTLLLLLNIAIAESANDECPPSGDFGFVCGAKSAEDLVHVPDTNWIIASSFEPGAGVLLVDAKQKNWSQLYPGVAPHAEQNMGDFSACPGVPIAETFVSHGLNLRPGKNGRSTLYVVVHGGREAIEVFDLDTNGTTPTLTWTGCILTPNNMPANSVASFKDGSLLITIPLETGNTIAEAIGQKKLTGAVYEWSPGDDSFTRIEGTDQPYGNGIEVSADEEEFYVASSGNYTVVAYSNTNPARQLRTTEPFDFAPDNLHMGSDGKLITAGLIVDDPVCGSIKPPIAFDLATFAGCPRPFVVRAVDPHSMKGRDLLRSPAIEQFSNITMAVTVGNEIWIGSFASDRIAYRSLSDHE